MSSHLYEEMFMTVIILDLEHVWWGTRESGDEYPNVPCDVTERRSPCVSPNKQNSVCCDAGRDASVDTDAHSSLTTNAVDTQLGKRRGKARLSRTFDGRTRSSQHFRSGLKLAENNSSTPPLLLHLHHL